MDPKFFSDDFVEDYVYDTYDRIIDEDDESFVKDNNFYYGNEDHERDIFGDGLATGTAFALAEELADEMREEHKYDLDENTDRDNMIQATSLLSRHSHSRLRPFEQYIDDICRGRRSLFEND